VAFDLAVDVGVALGILRSVVAGAGARLRSWSVGGELRILVVGGGIAGLTFAVAAARQGLEVQVAEQLAAVGAGAAGIGMHPNAMACLDRIGVGGVVRAVATALDAYYWTRPDGSVVPAQPFTAVWGAPTLAVHRADLADALSSAVVPQVVAFGRRVRVVEVRDGEVSVGFADGSTGTYDLVVGADGVRSVVRSAVLGQGYVRYGGACFWRTTLPSPLVERATGVPVEGGNIGLIPLVGDRTHFFAQIRTAAPFRDEVAGRVERLRARLGQTMPLGMDALAALPADEEVHFGALEWVEPPAWGVGRVVLVGDAAHAMAPVLALGGAMAIEDAVVLAEEIAGQRLDLAIESFRRRRDPRVRFVQERTELTVKRGTGHDLPGEPADPIEFYRRNYGPLLQPP
jgi:2-polyprenyl-6-methoxyphenol hydroxylase-like FAD-dependent oxidoreductase